MCTRFTFPTLFNGWFHRPTKPMAGLGFTALLGSLCFTGLTWAATVNGFDAHLDNGLLRLNLVTDQPVNPKIQKAVPSFDPASESETTVFIPGAILSSDLTQNGNPALMDTRGRFSAQAKTTAGGVVITLSNLQDKAFQLSVSQQHAQGPGAGASSNRLPESLNGSSSPSIMDTRSWRTGRDKSPLGLHLVTRPEETRPINFPSESKNIRPSILGQAPVVGFDHLPAVSSGSIGNWPFTSGSALTMANTSSSVQPYHWPKIGKTVTKAAGSNLDDPATTMSPVGLLQPAATPDLLTEALSSHPAAASPPLVQEVSIRPLLKELPVWLLPLLGFFLGGVGLLALTVTLVLVGGTLSHWPRRMRVALQAMASPAQPFTPSSADTPTASSGSVELNVRHSQPKPTSVNVKSGYAQAPVLSLNTVVRIVEPPMPTQTIEEAIQRTHCRNSGGRNYGNRRRYMPMQSEPNTNFPLHKRRVSMGLSLS